ncbi:hypothetical protein ACP70R_036484 [Stipagrostis hirtigluma subsp. patula]
MVAVRDEANAVAPQEGLKNVLCMEGGQGEASYMNNSQGQSRTLQLVIHVLMETLDKIRLPRRPERLLTFADLGCSCGQNTLVVADVVARHMAELYGSCGHAAPEICFYFSDLPSNDFNTLFRLLHDSPAAGVDGRYFSAGVCHTRF